MKLLIFVLIFALSILTFSCTYTEKSSNEQDQEQEVVDDDHEDDLDDIDRHDDDYEDDLDDIDRNDDDYEDDLDDIDENDDDYEDDDEISTSANWSTDIPDFVPVFTYGDILSITPARTSGNNTRWGLVIESIEEDAVTKYIDDLKNKGWNIDSETHAATVTIIQASRDSDAINMTFDNEGRTATMSISITD